MASRRTALLFMVVTLAAVTAAQSTVGQGMAGQSGAPESTATQSPGASNEEHDPLLDTPPLPKGKVTLIGGTVTGLDQIKNRITLQPFAGKKLNVFFDDRTHVYRDGIETTQLGIHKGDRVYVDTMLDKTRVFDDVTRRAVFRAGYFSCEFCNRAEERSWQRIGFRSEARHPGDGKAHPWPGQA